MPSMYQYCTQNVKINYFNHVTTCVSELIAHTLQNDDHFHFEHTCIHYSYTCNVYIIIMHCLTHKLFTLQSIILVARNVYKGGDPA